MKLRNSEPLSWQQFLKKKGDGKTHASSCIAPSYENRSTGGKIFSNAGVRYGSNALVYDKKSNMDSSALRKRYYSPKSSTVPLRLTCPDANTNFQMARVLQEISISKQDDVAFPATQVAAAFHRWRFSHLKAEQRLQIELVKAIERAETAEATVEERNIEINGLREDLRKVEEEKSMTITNLQADLLSLQNENDCGVQNSMDQLTGKSQERPSSFLKRSNFGSRFAKQKRKLVNQIKENVYTLDKKDTNNSNFRLERNKFLDPKTMNMLNKTSQSSWMPYRRSISCMVSLYNELQKLQDLIVKEARLHQEKVDICVCILLTITFFQTLQCICSQSVLSLCGCLYGRRNNVMLASRSSAQLTFT